MSGPPRLGATEDVAAPSGLTRNRLIGWHLAVKRGWAGPQWTCLERLWSGESQWRADALNENTGNHRLDPGMVGRYGDAYGIPQALPPNKMASAGPDWRTNPETQVRWGLTYIAGRYGTPCKALAKWEERGRATGSRWY